MGTTVILAMMAALGVLLAGVAVALPAANRGSSQPGRPDGATTLNWDSASLRDRINSPFEALANRASRRRRLSGGLTLLEHLARADLKFRTSEFVMVQIAFLIGGAAISLWRFGFGPQFVIAGVGGYLLPMRYVKFRQRQRDRKSTRLNSSHKSQSRMPSSA